MLIASLAGYTALDMSVQVAAARGSSRGWWIAASALAMGVGIWSMHFVAMLALNIGIPVVYNVPLLAVSIAIAVGASAITFTSAASTASTRGLAVASLAMGPAIAGMHYTGMAAMQMSARTVYDASLVALSVVIAVSASFGALVLARHFRGVPEHHSPLKIGASILMGAAVYGMHYTGMLAANFIPEAEPLRADEGVISTLGLGWAIVIGTILLIGLTLAAAIGNRLVGAAVSAANESDRQRIRMVDTLQQIGQSLTSELELDKIVQSVTDAGTELSGAEFGAFFYNVVNEVGEAYTLYSISGVPREAFSRFPMPRNTPIFAPTFYGEGTVRSDDITKDSRYGKMAPDHGMPEGHLPVRSYLAVPVISRTGSVLGGLFFGNASVGVFKEEHERLVEGIAGWAAVAMDNAQLFEAEKRARSEAERANGAKDDFLAVMSHELRTPLNAIIGYTNLLQTLPTSPEDTRQRLERVDLSARHLLHLIDELLTYSRLNVGEERLHIEDVDAALIASEVQALVEPLAIKKGLELACLLPDTPVLIRSDAHKIRQILLNLVSNGVKFSESGSVKMNVEQLGQELVVRVTDTGVGIAQEHHQKIYEPFWRAETGPTRVTGGTGLGLSVSRRLARMLGGDLNVASAPGSGSTFTLNLPMIAPGDVGGED